MDTVTRGALAGLAASIPFGALSWLLFALGLLPSTLFHYNAVFIIPPGTAVTALPLLLGAVLYLITGAVVGVGIAYLIRWTGPDYAWLKGAGVGAVLWPVHNTLIPSLKPEVWSALSLSLVFSNLFISIAWGLVAGLIIWVLAESAGVEG